MRLESDFFSKAISLHIILFAYRLSSHWVNGITYSVQENIPTGTIIGNLSADSRLDDVVGIIDLASLRYTILTGNYAGSSLFRISSSGGLLSVALPLDREELCPFVYDQVCHVDVEIAARHESLLRKFNVEIIVTDVNDNAPLFSKELLGNFQLPESVALYYPFPIETANDLDGSAVYSIIGYRLEPVDVPFDLTATKSHAGVWQVSLVVDERLDRETKSSYSMTIWAFDGGQPPLSGSSSIAITISDVNDNAPVFEHEIYYLNISESSKPGRTIIAVTATDPDEGENAEVLYSISSQQPQEDQDKFIIDPSSGNVSLARKQSTGVHRVIIEAQDQGTPPNPPSQTVIVVTVLDTDNSPPELSLDLLSVFDFDPGNVPESTPVSTAIGYLAVYDPDTGENAKVECKSMNIHFELQNINLDEYKIIISRPLDREIEAYQYIAIECTDGGNPPFTSTSMFDIFVLDINDNPPTFLQADYTAMIAENNAEQDGLLQVQAMDPDDGKNGDVHYRLLDWTSRFQVGQKTGMIKARRLLDFEERTEYVLRVEAADNGMPPLSSTVSISIQVLDINDQPPRFSAPTYRMNVTEELGEGLLVGVITAQDNDTGKGGQVDLSIVSQPGLVLPFAISPSGLLTTTARLDRDHRSSYSFHVRANDRGVQPLSSTALVRVRVLDVNDNAPVFVMSPANYTQTVYAPIIAKFAVSRVHAIDKDEGLNSVVTYLPIGGNATRIFRLDSRTGSIVTRVNLGSQSLGFYVLRVRASDMGNRSKHTDQDFIFRIELKNGTVARGWNSSHTYSDHYVIIVTCIVAFTVLISLAVVSIVVTLRRLDRQKKLQCDSTCCPQNLHEDISAKTITSTYACSEEYQKVSSANRVTVVPSTYVGKNLGVESEQRGDVINGACHVTQNFSTGICNAYRKNTNFQVSLPYQNDTQVLASHVTTSKKIEDFLSTSSNETANGDSGHGSDDDLTNHSRDRPMSPLQTHNVGRSRHSSMSAQRHLIGQHKFGTDIVPPRLPKIGRSTTPSNESWMHSAAIYDVSLHEINNAKDRRENTQRATKLSTTGNNVRFSTKDRREDTQRATKLSTTGNNVRFSTNVINYDVLGRQTQSQYISNRSLNDDESDLNTTTSGSFMLPLDDVYDNCNESALVSQANFSFPLPSYGKTNDNSIHDLIV